VAEVTPGMLYARPAMVHAVEGGGRTMPTWWDVPMDLRVDCAAEQGHFPVINKLILLGACAVTFLCNWCVLTGIRSIVIHLGVGTEVPPAAWVNNPLRKAKGQP